MSTKRGPLSKAEKFYIERNAELGAEQLAADLNRNVDQVSKQLDVPDEPEAESTNNPTAESTNNSTPRETRLMKLMGRHERKGTKVATVMTPQASMEADRTREKRLNKKQESSIHRPRG